MESIGERIWWIISTKRLRSQELADILEVRKQYLYDIKSGKIKNPGYSFFLKFRELGINPEWVMSGSGEPLLEEIKEVIHPEPKGIATDLYNKIWDELSSLRRQLEVKDHQISELIKLLGKPNVSTEIPPVGEGAVVLPLFPLANSCANTRNLMIA